MNRSERITRTINFEPEKQYAAPLRAVRYRDSDDNGYVELHVGSQRVRFQNDEIFGQGYAVAAADAAELLSKAAYEQCALDQAEGVLDAEVE